MRFHSWKVKLLHQTIPPTVLVKIKRRSVSGPPHAQLEAHGRVTLHVPTQGGGHRGRGRHVPLLAVLGRGKSATPRIGLTRVVTCSVSPSRCTASSDRPMISPGGDRSRCPRRPWPGTARAGVADRAYPGREPGRDLGGRDGRRAYRCRRARIPGEVAVIHGDLQHRADVGVDVAGVAAAYRRVDLQITHELADVDRTEGPERPRPDAGEGVLPKPGLAPIRVRSSPTVRSTRRRSGWSRRLPTCLAVSTSTRRPPG
jgi:hypothetical protein